MRNQVVWNAFDLRDGSAVVFAGRIDDEYVLQVFLQFCLQLLLLRQQTGQVQFVAPLIQSQQFPDVEQEIHRVEVTLHGITVLEFEAVLLEGKDLQLLVVEIAEEFLASLPMKLRRCR